MSSMLLLEERQGSLSNTLEVNLEEEDLKHYEAITLRSDKELKEPRREGVDAKELDELVKEEKGSTYKEPE